MSSGGWDQTPRPGVPPRLTPTIFQNESFRLILPSANSNRLAAAHLVDGGAG